MEEGNECWEKDESDSGRYHRDDDFGWCVLELAMLAMQRTLPILESSAFDRRRIEALTVR